MVMEALKTLPNLQSLDVNLHDSKVALRFDLLTGLRKLSISGTGDPFYEQTFDNIAKMVAKSPQLASIVIASSRSLPPCKPMLKSQSLHQFFQYYPHDAPPLRLRRLAILTTYLVRFDEMTMPHLMYLTSLSLLNILDTTDTRPRYSNGEDEDGEEIKKEQRKYGSSPKELWSMLTKSGVRLEEINIDDVASTFLEYLGSYSGLRKLRMSTEGFSESAYSDQLASQFYQIILRNHAHSLEELSINAFYEGLWCFGIHNQESISRCVKLKQLAMCMVSHRLAPIKEIAQGAQDVPDPASDDITLLLDTVALCVPGLETLHMSATNAEKFRGALCGNSSMFHLHQVNRLIAANVRKYRSDSSIQNLPNIKAGPRNYFVGERDGEGKVRYRDAAQPSPSVDKSDDGW
ncbi:hypothetical protein B0H34DRAFT_810264 [Crassisporium funariophilum]|nr:hypothetical protein B0H34DRAFT_810264 [Crassisporium funariophilum]